MNRLQTLVLGPDRRQQLRIRRMLTAAAVYGVSVAIQWQSVWVGRADAAAATGLSLLIGLGLVGFYAAVRSGRLLRLDDPALTMPQMVFALACLALAYRINWDIRGTLLMIVALVLVFGAFTLAPARCRRLGWIAVGLLGAAMTWGAVAQPADFPREIEIVTFLFAAVVLPTISVLAGQLSAMRSDQLHQKRELQVAVQRLHDMATHDDLTGLVNRRHAQDWIAHEVARERRTGAPLCLALIDLDHFKRVNDTLGHATGDETLRVFAREARTVLRDVDLLARWGGEEFMVVMPDTDSANARQVLERLRVHMAQPAVWSDCPAARVSFSAGLTTHLPSQTLERAVQRADALLYEAKHQGRDRIVAD